MSMFRRVLHCLRLAAVSALLLIIAAPTQADEPSSVTRHAAKNIIKIMDEHGDRGVLQFQARLHDAWKVCFHLVSLGRADLAQEFARTTDQPDLSVVLSKIDAWKAARLDAGVVAQWTAIDGAKEKKQWSAVLEHWKAFGDNAPPFLRLDAALACAHARVATGDLEGAFDLLKLAAQQARDMGWIWGEARAYWRLGHVHHKRGEYESALESWTRCTAAYDRRGDVIAAAMARANVAALHVDLGDSWPAISLWEEGLEIYRARNEDGKYTKTIIRQLQNLGWARAAVGPYAAALAAFQESRDLAVSAGIEADIVEADIGLATILLRLGEWGRAEAAAKAAVKGAKALDATVDVARAQGTLGLVYFDEGRFEAARAPYERALATLRALSEDDTLVAQSRDELSRWVNVAKGNLAHTLVALDEDPLAELHFKQVLGSKHLTTASEVDAREGLGELHFKNGEFDKALAEFKKARTLAVDAELVPQLVKIHGNIAETLIARGNHAGALDAAREGIEYLAESTRGLGHAQQASARARRMRLFHLGMRAAAEVGDVHAFNEVLESSRAFALLELLEDRNALLKALIPDELVRAREPSYNASSHAQHADDRPDHRSRRPHLSGHGPVSDAPHAPVGAAARRLHGADRGA